MHHDLALRIALQNGLDLQKRAGQRRRAGQTATLAQELQVVYHEQLSHLAAELRRAGGDRIHIGALLRQIRRLQHHQTLAQRSAPAVQHPDVPVGIALPQLLRHHAHAPAGAADAAGQPDIQHVIALLQHGLHGFAGGQGADHGGLDLRALAHGFIIGVAVKGGGHVRRYAVDGIGQAQLPDAVLLPQLRRQVGRVVCHHSNHDMSPFIMEITYYSRSRIQPASVSNRQR